MSKEKIKEKKINKNLPVPANSLEKYFEKKLALAVDIKEDKVATHGWKNHLDQSPLDLINQLDKSIFIDVFFYKMICRFRHGMAQELSMYS